MKKGDKIIWDSHFGYEIGYYMKDEGVEYNTCLVNLTTGIVNGPVSHSVHEVHSYTEEKIKELTDKYGYETKF